jgi:diguanylate cyclase (GGDEF)-like protein/PAS domain S-box-containing protein
LLYIPVHVEGKHWGKLCFVDSRTQQREWNWAETDTLRTLAGLIGMAMTRARYVKELADANTIVQNSPTILYRIKGEPPFPLVYVSHNITKFGHEPVQLLRNANWIDQLVVEDDRKDWREALLRMMEGNGDASMLEFRLHADSGQSRWVENRYTPIRDKEGRLAEVEGIIIDITERKAAEERIAAMARTDALTGLANRATFNERLQQAFAATRRGGRPFAVFYMDLDRFKTVNDTWGHAIGDELLKETAQRLRECVRETDVVARLGGDEFALLQMDISEPSNAATLARYIHQTLGSPMLLAGNELRSSCSIGICPWSADIKDADSMLVQADLALYRAKEDGRNCYRFHSGELDKEVLQRNALADELRIGIEGGELELAWQPQVSIADRCIVGIEALVRWRHPVRGLLEAHDFIPVAEKTGSIVALGHWVLDAACRQLREWRDAGLQLQQITLNLSQNQLKNDAELIGDVATLTAKWGLLPADLEFDVTEAMLAQTTWTQNDVLHRLRALGCKIAIDNFGSAYSSLDYLRAYQVNHLKVASTFIRQAAQDPEHASTLKAIIQLAHDLNVGIVVEGVETAEENALLQSINQSSRAQGYFYSPALDGAAASALLTSAAPLS